MKVEWDKSSLLEEGLSGNDDPKLGLDFKRELIQKQRVSTEVEEAVSQSNEFYMFRI